jgi:hypothetical protein
MRAIILPESAESGKPNVNWGALIKAERTDAESMSTNE